MDKLSVRLDATNAQQLKDIYAFFNAIGSSDTEKFRDFLAKASALVLKYKTSEKLSDPKILEEIDNDITACKYHGVGTFVKPKSRRLNEQDTTEEIHFCIRPPEIKGKHTPKEQPLKLFPQTCRVCKAHQMLLKELAEAAKKAEAEQQAREAMSAIKAAPTYAPQPIMRTVERPQATVFESAPQPKTKYPLVHGWEEYAFVEKPDGSRLCPFHSGEPVGLGWKYVYFHTDCKRCRATTPDKAKQCNEVRLYLHALKRPHA